jgi:hypothetical protein
MEKVFISYSHDSPEHSERVLALSNRLRALGIDAELDRYHVRPTQGWPHSDSGPSLGDLGRRAYRPIEASEAVVCHVRSTPIPAVSIATNVSLETGSTGRAEGRRGTAAAAPP